MAASSIVGRNKAVGNALRGFPSAAERHAGRSLQFRRQSTLRNPSPELRCACSGPRISRQRSGFTLLEVILALGLTTVTVALMGMAIQVNLDVADKCQDQVATAKMARALMQQIADDFANAVPFQPPAGSTSSSGSGSTTSPSAGASSSSGAGSASSSGAGSLSSSTSSATTPVSGGVFSTDQGVQIETSRRPRLTKAMLSAIDDGTQPPMLGDVRVVSYSLGPPGGLAPSGSSSTSASNGSPGGLYRSDTDRNAFYSQVQQGQTNPTPGAIRKLGDPDVGEVVDLKFQYYDNSGTENDEWDSIEQGNLPSTVRVTIFIRPAKRSSPGGSVLSAFRSGAAKERPVAIYSRLIDLPNATVPANEFQSLGQVDTMGLSSGSGAQSAPASNQ